jgi:hypothetical protein
MGRGPADGIWEVWISIKLVAGGALRLGRNLWHSMLLESTYLAKREYIQPRQSESLNCLAETRQRAGGPVVWIKPQPNGTLERRVKLGARDVDLSSCWVSPEQSDQEILPR